MTSSWFIRERAFQAIFHDGFWNSDHDVLIVINNNFLSAMHGFEITRFYWQPDMTSSSIVRQGERHAIVHDTFWKSDLNFLIAFDSNVLSAMHGFPYNVVLLLTGYEVIVISPLEGDSDDFHDIFWKSNRDFLIAFHSNFLTFFLGCIVSEKTRFYCQPDMTSSWFLC